MKRFKNILCALSPEAACKPALERAVALAQNNQAALTLVTVAPEMTAGIGMPDDGPISAQLQSAVTAEHQQALDGLVAPFRGKIEIQTRVLRGTPFLAIIREVLSNGHDLVIKAPEQWDWLDRLFGSDDMHLLRKCPCPVWIIKPQAQKSYRRILAAVDVDDSYPADELQVRKAMNRQILEMASSLALSEFAELHIVHAWESTGESAMRGAFMSFPEEKIQDYVNGVRRHQEANLKQLLDQVNSKLGQEVSDYLKPQTHLVKGGARREIPLLAHQLEADLIVMGTVARTGIPGFIMGNSAEMILNQIDCSVLAIKPQGFVTPVTLDG